MFLASLSLRNIRSLQDFSISFTTQDGSLCRRWTLLLGENGTGKSSVLRAIALVMAGSDALLELIRDPNLWITKGKQKAEIQIGILTSDKKKRTVTFEFHRGSTTKDLLLSNQDAMNSLDRALSYTKRNYLTLGYGASRRWSADKPMSAQQGSAGLVHPRARAVASLFTGEAMLNPLESWAVHQHYTLGEEGLSSVREALNSLLPEIRFETIDRKSGKLLFRTQDGLIPMELLSDGYQSMAAWCGDLLFRVTSLFKNYKNPLDARGLLLLDEIDLHLHPTWQRHLRAFLDRTLPNFQIVATTHSPLTVQQAQEGEVFALIRGEGGGSPAIHPFRGDPRRLFVQQVLLDPTFGLKTVASRRTEILRQALEVHRNRRKGSRQELASLEQELPELGRMTTDDIEEALKELPSWSPATGSEEEQSLLRAIHAELASSSRARKQKK